MTDKSRKYINFVVSPASGIFEYSNYFGFVLRLNSARWSIYLFQDDKLKDVVGHYYNNAYHWDVLALNSKIAKESVTVAKANTSYSSGSILFEKSGDVVRVMLNGFEALPTGGFSEICSIPSGFAPSTSKYYDIYVGNDNVNNGLRVIRVLIGTTKLSAYNYGAELTNANAQPIVMYIK